MAARQKVIRTPLVCRAPKREHHEAELIARQDKSLAQALERSRRVGGMLLKREDEELREISKLADEMIQREYRSVGAPWLFSLV